MTTQTLASPAPIAVPAPRRGRRKGVGAAIARYVVLSIFAVGILAPLYVMVSAALKSPAEAGTEGMWLLPRSIDLGGLRTAWNALAPNLLNSVAVVVPGALISSMIGSVNGFLLAKIKFRYSTIAFIVLLVGMYIPYQAVLVPLVKTLERIGLYGSLTGLTLTSIVYGIPITTLIFRNYYTGIPSDLVEAASLDGAGLLRTFRSVFLPLSGPGFVVCLIFQFTGIWNDFLFALVLIPDNARQPVMVALNNLSGTTSVAWNVVMAGALIAAIPTLIAYIFFGRFFVRGLIAGSYR